MSASPDGSHPVRCFTHAAGQLRTLIAGQLRAWGAGLCPRRIVIKPNWVMHQTDPAFPIRALVTDPGVIEATVEACLELYPDSDSILIGDCPLQSADWPRLCDQSGLTPVIERLTREGGGRVTFRDLRREVYRPGPDGFLVPCDTGQGDPRGYREVELGVRSLLEPISDQAGRFAVNDYSAAVTRSNHRRGCHRYLVSQSVLDADLFINLPKWKTHQKAGMTGALKNLVGINGDKAYLPHFRRGAPKWGGDEYRDANRWLYWMQTTLRERLQKHSRLAFRMLKPGWELIKRARGIQTRLDNPQSPPANFYIAGGAWPGNQTLWRTIYDLNLIVQCADAAGHVGDQPARKYFCIVDGLVSGEGNGPLQALPRETGWLVCGDNPFAVDAALTWFMGFEPERLPVIAGRRRYAGPDWGAFELAGLRVELDGQSLAVLESGVNHRFVPPPGWRNHVER